MNKKDLQRTERLNEAIRSIPNPNDDWRQSQIAKVLINHSKSMVLFAFWMKEYLKNVMLEYHWKNHPENGVDWNFDDEFGDWIDPDKMLDVLEQWVQDLKGDRYENDLPMREVSPPDK